MIIATALAALAMAGEMPWAKSFTEAQAQAQHSGKLIMVDFYTDWCGWCKTLDAETYTDEGVIRAAQQFVPLKTDAEKEGKDLAAKYKVTGFPTILFIDAKGDAYGRISGFIPAGMFEDLIKTINEAYKGYPAAVKTLSKEPGDGRANAIVAMASLARMDEAATNKALAAAEKAGFKESLLVKVHNLRGDVLQGQGKMDEAIASWLKAYGMATKNEDRYYSLLSLAYGYAGKGDKENTTKYGKMFMELPGAPETYKKLIKSLVEG